MALNLQTLKTRSISAIFFVAIMLLGLCYNQWTFLLLFSIIHAGCWWEYQQLVGAIYPAYKTITPFHKYGAIVLGQALLLLASRHHYNFGTLALDAVGAWLFLTCMVALPVGIIVIGKNTETNTIKHTIIGWIYLSLSWMCMQLLRNSDDSQHQTGQWIPIIIIATIWINDTMAYIVGSLIGKTPLSAISPKKTWEGTIGGAILAIGVVSLGLPPIVHTYVNEAALQVSLLGKLLPWQVLVPLTAVIATVGTLGDLLESKLKRMAGVKDSGNMMPGHGGFLDRFDSLLLATPTVWLFTEMLLRW
ncbi:MAG: phosphatidate cytidylyltransferase [Chitinophagaceae bacterium]